MDLSAIIREIPSDFLSVFNGLSLGRLISFVVAVVLILVIAKLLELAVGRTVKGHISDQAAMVIRKAIRYTAFVIVIMTVFNRMGLDLSALLGAAGIAGIAVGFAAQTSVSNIISGVFLISEKSFSVGDVINVSDVTGIVEAVDLLSIKIKTFDNRFVRIPNETLIKTNVVNVTRYPIRRMDVTVSVSYGDDLEKALAVLRSVAQGNVYALDNPEPLVVISQFGASGIDILCGFWFEKSDYLALKNSMMIDIKRRFEAEGLSIPFPQMDVHLDGGENAGPGKPL